MSKFSQDELNQVLFALELMSQKIEIGYKNAIKNGTLPLDIVSNKGLHDFFIKSVNDFDRIRDILTKNNPIDMTNDEWNEITYLCILFIGDARNKGGIVNDFIMPVDHVVNVIFRKKRMEIFGSVEPPSFMNNSQKSSNSQTQTGSCYIDISKMKRPVLFWIGSVLNIMMIPLLFYNVVVAVALGFIGFIIARSSGCTFE